MISCESENDIYCTNVKESLSKFGRCLRPGDATVRACPGASQLVWRPRAQGWGVVELASEKVEELVKSFEHVNEILDGFRYKQEPILLIQRHSGQSLTFAVSVCKGTYSNVTVSRQYRTGLVRRRK